MNNDLMTQHDGLGRAPSRGKPGNPFQPGHPKYGGRAKGTPNKKTRFAAELAAEMKVDPVQFMLELLNSDVLEVPVTDKEGNVVTDAEGRVVRRKIAVPVDVRLDAAKAVAPFVYPKLQATSLSGPDDERLFGGPDIDMTVLLANPEAAKAAAALGLAMAEQERQRYLTGGE